MFTKNRKEFRKIVGLYLACVTLLGQAQAMEDEWTPKTAKDFASRRGQDYLRELKELRELEKKPTPKQNYLLALEAWENEKRDLLTRVLD